MYGVDPIQLAAADSALTRAIAMKEMCEKWNAPAETLANADLRIRDCWNEKQIILSKGLPVDYERRERQVEMYSRLMSAFDTDPDQSQTVSWWAD